MKAFPLRHFTLACALSVFIPIQVRANETALAIIDAGVQQSEDSPFVSTDYQFLPGDFVWTSFHISGFVVQIDEEKQTRAISLTYSVVPEDANGVALAEPVSGEIREQLSAEDKNWTPIRRMSFLLPSFVVAGDFHMHIAAKDLLGKAEVAKDVPFRIGGLHIKPAQSITAENFRFLRDENAREVLDIAAYQPGDTVFTDFDMVGFTVGQGNTYRVAYGVLVLGPDNKPFLDDPDAAKLSSSSFYPAQYVPGTLNITTKAASLRGQYTIILTVRDLISGKSSVTQRTFTLE
ncbi:MAG: hypothetical protein JO061_14065 [Acidobacteriaceae bacterium]|nr:hypothetical protein [Acidobacteriaceae bacterium]